MEPGIALGVRRLSIVDVEGGRQPVSDESETRAGLILPASAAAAVACRTGIVTAIGADVTGVEPGDKVLYPREAGFEVRLGGIEVKVVKRDELIARIHD